MFAFFLTAVVGYFVVSGDLGALGWIFYSLIVLYKLLTFTSDSMQKDTKKVQ